MLACGNRMREIREPKAERCSWKGERARLGRSEPRLAAHTSARNRPTVW
jgi:hypothetical protein